MVVEQNQGFTDCSSPTFTFWASLMFSSRRDYRTLMRDKFLFIQKELSRFNGIALISLHIKMQRLAKVASTRQVRRKRLCAFYFAQTIPCSSSTLSSFSHGKIISVLPKCPYAAVFL